MRHSRGLRPRVALTVSMLLAASMLPLLGPAAAVAETGPSVPLPEVPSVPATAQQMASRPPDEATGRALRGDQQPGVTPPGGGAATATPLAPSSTWDVSAQSGDFSWSYPLPVPPAAGGLEPRLALTYSSSAVDGRTSTTNNQPSWIGDGWELNPGFVERTYSGCADDKGGGTVPPVTGDLCWRSDNATAAYPGGGGMLICCDSTGKWRPRTDDGSRVERLTGAANGDNDGEYWKITTVDGTQYFFGSRPQAQSTWTVPVFGDDNAEPCHGATFDASSCSQAWRWNLDKVVDRNGNVMVLSYVPETNSYGRNLNDAAVSYVRGGTLRMIEYGLHENPDAVASGQVEFITADRCVPGSTCTLDRPENWPDTLLSERCETATCRDHYAPTFWSTKRLDTIVTRVRSGAAWSDVDSWKLEQLFPDPGDGEKAALWLKSIVHTGHAGTPIALPPVTFEGAKKANRVFKADGVGWLVRFRITGIVTETGGVISVNYADPDCTAQSLPANPETNTKRCFPVRWTPKNASERTDYFHKYVVASVATTDRIATNPAQQTTYEYLDGAAWHYDDSEFTPDDKRTWNEYRGFGRVVIRGGTSNDGSGSPISKTERRFYRGMNGEVEDSERVRHADHDWLRGFPLETITYNGDGGPVVTKTITDPTWQGPTATRGTFKAYIVRPGVERTFTALAGGTWRVAKTERTYDDRAQLIRINDLGDEAVTTDDRCTTTTLARNTERWLLSFPARVETVGIRCGATPVWPDDAISDARTAYDGHGFGDAPTAGNPTAIDEADTRPASNPVYVRVSTIGYDAHGRPTEVRDALDRRTRTAYTPTLGGPLNQTVSTNPLEHTVTTTLEPAHGNEILVVDANGLSTESTYDALGRRTEIWLPNRSRSNPDDPRGNARFSYLIRRDAPTVVSTSKLGPLEDYVNTNVLYDGLLRARQVQSPAPGGGRLIIDTRYDSQGRAFKTTQPYFNDGTVDTTLWDASDTEVPGLTLTVHDGAGRPTAAIFKGRGTEKWRTTTDYGGDWTRLTPPAGGITTTTITNARNQTTELRQHHNRTAPGSGYDKTTYDFTKAGQLSKLTDPAGNMWEHRYDLRGREIWTKAPDSGITEATFDNAGQLKTRTDSRAQTLEFDYDALGRRTALRSGSTQLAGWTYDTVPHAKGQLATATRYVNGAAYTTTIDEYSSLYLPLSTTVTIPAAEGLLAGSYTTKLTYKVDGSVASEEYPAIGDPDRPGALGKELVRHTYDDLSLPQRTYGGMNSTTAEYALSTDYTRYGEPQRVTLGEGPKRAWLSTYYEDDTRRVRRSIVDAEVPRPIQADLNYTYDPTGNITSIADRTLDRPADLQCFRYDYLQRLTEAWTPPADCAANPSTGALAGPAPYWQSFTYDVVGNRRTDTGHTASGDTTRTYTYPNPGGIRPHAVSSVTTTGPGGPGATAYQYDNAGNTTNRGAQAMTWDPQGHLATVAEAGKTTEFRYDTTGSRLIRRDPVSTTLYLPGQELQFNRTTGALTGIRYYVHSGSVIAVRTASGVSWLAGDHHGTGLVAVDTATMAPAMRRADPFGNPRGAPPASWPDDKGFVGGTLDSSTGLTHIGAREYDPTLGRFLSVDPVLDRGAPQQLNGYAYGNNAPTTTSDPTGMTWDTSTDTDPANWYGSNGGCINVRCGAPNPYPSRPQPRNSASVDNGCDGRARCANPNVARGSPCLVGWDPLTPGCNPKPPKPPVLQGPVKPHPGTYDECFNRNLDLLEICYVEGGGTAVGSGVGPDHLNKPPPPPAPKPAKIGFWEGLWQGLKLSSTPLSPIANTIDSGSLSVCGSGGVYIHGEACIAVDRRGGGVTYGATLPFTTGADVSVKVSQSDVEGLGGFEGSTGLRRFTVSISDNGDMSVAYRVWGIEQSMGVTPPPIIPGVSWSHRWWNW